MARWGERDGREQRGREQASEADLAKTPGKRTLVEGSSEFAPSGPGKTTLAQHLPSGPASEVELTDALAHALSHRSGGSRVDASIAAAVGAQTGVALGDVVVHKNGEVQRATRAM